MEYILTINSCQVIYILPWKQNHAKYQKIIILESKLTWKVILQKYICTKTYFIQHVFLEFKKT